MCVVLQLFDLPYVSRGASVQHQDDETGSAQGYEMVGIADSEYEEIDEPRDTRRGANSHNKKLFKFTQCPAYTPMHTSN